MRRELFLGIDIGTQSTKGVLVDCYGHIVAQHAIPHRVFHPKPGWAEHDPEMHWWTDVVSLIRNLLLKPTVRPERVACICIGGLIPVFAPTDAAGVPLCNAILYSDNRAVAEIEQINVQFGFNLTSEEIVPKILWFLRNHPGQAPRMAMIFNPHSYIVFKLTGAYTTDSITACYWGGIYSPMRNHWRKDVCDILGISVDILPPVYPPSTVAGTVTSAAAEITGLVEGIPVLVGSGDVFFSLLGAGVITPVEMMIYYGSAGLVAIPRRHLQVLATKPYDVEGDVPFACPSYHPASGELIRWFSKEFRQIEDISLDTQNVTTEEILDSLASVIPPGAEGLVMLPYFLGQRTPIFDPHARGAFVGLTLAHGRAHLYRAILEAYGLGVRYSLEHWSEQFSIQRVVATGGGARSSLWRQIVSDITGIRQEYVALADAALGGAFLAAYAVGAIEEFHRVSQMPWLQTVQVTEPNLEMKALYENIYTIFCGLHDALRQLSKELSHLS
jgi:xylulokinase